LKVVKDTLKMKANTLFLNIIIIFLAIICCQSVAASISLEIADLPSVNR